MTILKRVRARVARDCFQSSSSWQKVDSFHSTRLFYSHIEGTTHSSSARRTREAIAYWALLGTHGMTHGGPLASVIRLLRVGRLGRSGGRRIPPGGEGLITSWKDNDLHDAIRIAGSGTNSQSATVRLYERAAPRHSVRCYVDSAVIPSFVIPIFLQDRRCVLPRLGKTRAYCLEAAVAMNSTWRPRLERR